MSSVLFVNEIRSIIIEPIEPNGHSGLERHIRIKKGENERFDITLFANTEDALTISGSVEDQIEIANIRADNARLRHALIIALRYICADYEAHRRGTSYPRNHDEVIEAATIALDGAGEDAS